MDNIKSTLSYFRLQLETKGYKMLENIEHKSKLMLKAMSMGVKTLDGYEVWLQGYEVGYMQRHEDSLEVVEESFEEPFTRFAEAVIKEEKEKENV